MKWALIKMASMHMRKISFISSSLSSNTEKNIPDIFFKFYKKYNGKSCKIEFIFHRRCEILSKPKKERKSLLFDQVFVK